MMTMLMMMITDQILTCTSTYTQNNDDYADYRSNVNMHINTHNNDDYADDADYRSNVIMHINITHIILMMMITD